MAAIKIDTTLPYFSAGIAFPKGVSYVLAEGLTAKQVAQLRARFKDGFAEVDEVPHGARVIEAPKAEKPEEPEPGKKPAAKAAKK
jgi:hypothetical protein